MSWIPVAELDNLMSQPNAEGLTTATISTREDTPASISTGDHVQRIPVPLYKLMLRLAGLQRGRHVLIVTVANGVLDWSILGEGKVEG